MRLLFGRKRRQRHRAELAVRGVTTADRRLPVMEMGQEFLRKAFPDHWSFLLGELALYSFIVLVVTGTFLALFFVPSLTQGVYHGPYRPLDGIRMSDAFASTLDITFDVRGGLLMRQVHHWAALVFVASFSVHMLRIFFTGAFRRPREINWTIGVTLFMFSLLEGFCGYSLPDDLMSGTGLRTAAGIVESIPIIGTYLVFFIFGGQYPGHIINQRMYIVHVLLIPGLLAALIGVHLILVVYLKHTQWAEQGRTNRNVIGKPMVPLYTAKSMGLFFTLFGVLTALGALIQINPVWRYGPYRTDQASTNSQPDWYLGYLEGALRIMPSAETNGLGHTVAWGVWVPGALYPALMFVILYCYPFFERWLSGNTGEHHLCDRPRNHPARTGLGVGAVTIYAVTLIAGGDDVIAREFVISVNAVAWVCRVCFVILPPLAFWITRRCCLGLQAHDAQTLREGVATDTLRRTPAGGYREVRRMFPAKEASMLAVRDLADPITIAEGRLATRRDRLRAGLSGWYLRRRVELPLSDEERLQVTGITAEPYEHESSSE